MNENNGQPVPLEDESVEVASGGATNPGGVVGDDPVYQCRTCGNYFSGYAAATMHWVNTGRGHLIYHQNV